MTALYTPPGFNECTPPETWNKGVFRGPYPRGGRRKRRKTVFLLPALIVAGIVATAIVATDYLESAVSAQCDGLEKGFEGGQC